jgi:predicted  nucleic acid-binding Zn-ribbon protein
MKEFSKEVAFTIGVPVAIIAAMLMYSDYVDKKRADERVGRLRRVVEVAALDNAGNCSGFLAEVGRSYFPTDAQGYTELDGKLANDQIQYMYDRWEERSPKGALFLANQGALVVAGRKGDALKDESTGLPRTGPKGRPVLLSGHVAVVMPGQLDARGYPPVAGGAVSEIARSLEGQPISYSWRAEADQKNGEVKAPLSQVRFYAPKDALKLAVDASVKNEKVTDPHPGRKTTFAYDENAVKSSQVGKRDSTVPGDAIRSAVIESYLTPDARRDGPIEVKGLDKFVDVKPIGPVAQSERTLVVDNDRGTQSSRPQATRKIYEIESYKGDTLQGLSYHPNFSQAEKYRQSMIERNPDLRYKYPEPATLSETRKRLEGWNQKLKSLSDRRTRLVEEVLRQDKNLSRMGDQLDSLRDALSGEYQTIQSLRSQIVLPGQGSQFNMLDPRQQAIIRNNASLQSKIKSAEAGIRSLQDQVDTLAPRIKKDRSLFFQNGAEAKRIFASLTQGASRNQEAWNSFANAVESTSPPDISGSNVNLTRRGRSAEVSGGTTTQAETGGARLPKSLDAGGEDNDHAKP